MADMTKLYEAMLDKGLDVCQQHYFLEPYGLLSTRFDWQVNLESKLIEKAMIELSFSRHYDTKAFRPKTENPVQYFLKSAFRDVIRNIPYLIERHNSVKNNLFYMGQPVILN